MIGFLEMQVVLKGSTLGYIISGTLLSTDSSISLPIGSSKKISTVRGACGAQAWAKIFTTTRTRSAKGSYWDFGA